MKWPGNARRQPTTFGNLKRSELMSKIRSKGNKTTELRMVQLLKKAGISGWRRHLPLPGKPDFTWPKEMVSVFVDGCFWHGHNCRNLSPKTNARSWCNKIERNKQRDKRVARKLRRLGWSVLRVWECQLSISTLQVVRKIEQTILRKQLNVEKKSGPNLD